MKRTEKNSNMRIQILRSRYLGKNEQGDVIETPEQMFRRVADAIAASESRYGVSGNEQKTIADKFYDLMVKGLFLPNSPTLMNAGRENEMLSACFVLSVEDSIDAIFDAVKYAALIQKAGGGTGFSFDRLRPTGDIVKSSGGKTSGPISFMKVFSEATSAIQQGAFRRGANMGMMSIEHPDILNFIHTKEDPTAFTNFNLSVIGWNDQLVRFYRQRKKAKPKPEHKQLTAILRRLGLSVTISQVRKASRQLGLSIASEESINGETIQRLIKYFYGGCQKGV